MFLVCFCKHQYSRGKAVAANHVQPTQLIMHNEALHAAASNNKLEGAKAKFAPLLNPTRLTKT